MRLYEGALSVKCFGACRKELSRMSTVRLILYSFILCCCFSHTYSFLFKMIMFLLTMFIRPQDLGVSLAFIRDYVPVGHDFLTHDLIDCAAS